MCVATKLRFTKNSTEVVPFTWKPRVTAVPLATSMPLSVVVAVPSFSVTQSMLLSPSSTWKTIRSAAVNMASGFVAKLTVRPMQISIALPSASVGVTLVSNQISLPEAIAKISLPCTEAPSLSVVA